MHSVSVADRLEELLELASPPVALAFVDHAPQNVPVFAGEMPSSCSFWREGEKDVFFVPAEAHLNCLVGAMTMGFTIPTEASEKLNEVVERMCSCGYISQDEPAHMPVMQRRSVGIVYGPFKEFPIDPHLIVMWLTPQQAMLFSEATGNVTWSGTGGMPVTGRPACSALPLAFNGEEPRLSMGCIGMRSFTEVSGEMMLAVLPNSKVSDFVESLAGIVSANSKMQSWYRDQRAALVSR
jgi:uncharacterized protein (DUF169 family)